MSRENKTQPTDPLFNNPLLEKLTKTHIAVPIGSLLLYATGLFVWGKWQAGVSYSTLAYLFVSGLFLFTLAEYLIHRFAYHFEARTEKQKKRRYRIHGVHHAFPKDKRRLAMPPIISISLVTVLLIILKFTIGSYTYGFLSGFVTGYAPYLFMHYILHAYPPPKNFFRWLWIYHSIHHFKDDTIYFGVSSPLWDFVFGTVQKKEAN